MQTRRFDERLARNVANRARAMAAADRTKQMVDREAALLFRNAGVQEVSDRTLRRIKDYAADAFGDERYYPWLYFYTLYRGDFHEGWVPQDFFQDVALDRVNGPYRRICGARTLYKRLLGSDRVPDLLYCVKGQWTCPDGVPVDAAEVRDRLFTANRKVVVKLEGSAKGIGVTVETADSFSTEACARRGNLTVQRYVQQSDSLAAIYPDAVATFRVNTIKPGAEPATCVGTFLRIGRDKAVVVDAMSIDVPVLDPSGLLGPFATARDWHRLPSHPDTGFVFDGASVEGCSAAVAACEALHERLPQLGFIGWDATVDAAGEVHILEMNAGRPAIRFMEISLGPCLKNLNVERYARQGRLRLGVWNRPESRAVFAATCDILSLRT